MQVVRRGAARSPWIAMSPRYLLENVQAAARNPSLLQTSHKAQARFSISPSLGACAISWGFPQGRANRDNPHRAPRPAAQYVLARVDSARVPITPTWMRRLVGRAGQDDDSPPRLSWHPD